MALVFKGGERQVSPEASGDGDDETPEEFEERIYLALMRAARSSSTRVRDALGSCVMLGTPYEAAGRAVQDTIRKFIEDADL